MEEEVVEEEMEEVDKYSTVKENSLISTIH